MTVRNIRKSLAGMEDIVQGVGKVSQKRANSTHEIGRMDVPYAVESIAEMQALDVDVFTRARVYDSTTSYADYIYDESDISGVLPNDGGGSWVSAARNSLRFATQFTTSRLPLGTRFTTDGYTTANDGGHGDYLVMTAADYGETPDEVGAAFTDTNGNVVVLQYNTGVSLKTFGGDKAAALAATAARPEPIDLYTEDAVELIDKTNPLNYIGTKASRVVHNLDTADLGDNGFSPALVFDMTSTGNGNVVAGSEFSSSIWQGAFASFNKTGDGSMHSYTATGQVGAYGPGGYNEGGLYQGELTNVGSELATLSGVELLIKDSPDGGTTTYSSKMQGIVGRIAKYNPTIRPSHNFFASSEGALPPTAILGGNPNGLATWERGIDFQGLSFSSGQAALFPNNTSLAWLTAGGAAKPIMFVSNLNHTFIPFAEDVNKVAITNSTFASRFEVDNSSDAVLIYVGGTLKRVQQGGADSAGVGFRQLRVPN